MTDEEENIAREEAWKKVHDSQNREGKWTVGEYGTCYGFFLIGWNACSLRMKENKEEKHD